MNPENRVLPENAFEEGGEVGFYEMDGKLYTGYLKKMGEIEVTYDSGQKEMVPVYVTKVRDRGTHSGKLGSTSEYLTVFPNGKAISTQTNDDNDSRAIETIMKALSAKPEKVLSLSNEGTKIYNPKMLEELEIQQRNSQYTPNTPSEQSGALNTVQKEVAINNRSAKRTRHKLRAVDTTREVWDQKKELTWLSKVLPQLSEQDRVRVVQGLIQVSENGPVAWGMFSDGIITLSDIASKGTTYHEAFHVVFNLMLSQSEREVLFAEARQKFGNKSNLELEEDMAEGFREYVVSQETAGFGRRIINFFKNLFAKIKNWFQFKPSLYAYYSMINQGKYAGNSVSQKSETRLREEEYTSEMQDIKKRAIADGSFMKAPNGKPTNLTERQWLQVRTKAFKDWFGDWELIAYDKADLDSIPNLRKININSFLKKIDNILEKDYLTTGYLSRESVEVIKKLFDLSKTQLYQGDIKEQGLSFYTGAIVLRTMPMEEAARVFVHEVLHSYTTYAYDTDVAFRKEIDRYHKIALSHNSGFNKDVYEFMANTLEPIHMATLLEIPSENNSSNLLKDIINSFVKHIREFFKTYETNNKRTLFHDIIETIYNHKRNNSESINNVSKVVDENGEPLVVWHGGDYKNDATIIGDWSKNALPYATYFAPYQGYVNFKHVYSAFLNIKNPIYSDELLTEEAIQDEDVFKKVIIDRGYDGAISGTQIESYKTPSNATKAREIVVVNPNQIKSATDNTGEFSTTNNDIRYRVASTIEELQRFSLKENKINNTYFNSLDSEVKTYLLNKGWTKQEFDRISQAERDQAVRCAGL